ncbi:MAG TPA: SDR family NAD(P)-dependent oxidoreductase [Candidatus Kapabacteria bacterium]|nr:SDR family NAD(P)-dependent oxidoreductase [Candidatus Kapabacteria bacterium]
MNLPWKHAIVVGASSGIGEAIARRLVHAGCRVALIARRADRLEAICAELNREAGWEVALAVPHDVHRHEEIPWLFQNCALRLGGMDAIFYASGVLPRIAPDEYETATDVETIQVNLLGAIAWLNQAALRFEKTGSGTIVGIGSIAGDRGRRGNPVYCTSKAALATYLESLRNRLGRRGVKVVTAKPGFIDTEMTHGLAGMIWLISADRAAELILRAARRGRTVAYIPERWRLVGLVLRMIPSFLFRRLNV